MKLGELFFYTHGRVSRKVWWISNILIWILGLLTTWIWHRYGFHDALFGVVLTVILFYLRLNINIKRLHDRGKHGWRVFTWWAFSEIPFVGFITYGVLKGSEGENQHGPSA